MNDNERQLRATLKTLSERLWEGHGREADVDRWLGNFTGEVMDQDTERLHALHLLTHLTYFGLRELRVLLRAIYRDLFRYPIVQQIRESNSGTRNSATIERIFRDELNATRFVGMGNPAESGTHLLYYFRQENELPKNLFISSHEILSGAASDDGTEFADTSLKRLVFVDDFLGSGQQALSYSRTLLDDLSRVSARTGQQVDFLYYVLFARAEGLEVASRESRFAEVRAIHILDGQYQTFGPDSRVYRNPPGSVDPTIGRAIATHYGTKIAPGQPLGYRDNQMLLALHHNTPDNTLPIIWAESRGVWSPIISRYSKVY